MRKNSILILFFILISFSHYGQPKLFVTTIKGIDAKVDSLPYFIYEKAELDTFFLNNQIIPVEEEIWGINVYVHASFFIDTLGNPNNIIIYKVDININELTELKKYEYIDTMKVYFSKESARLIMLTEGMWSANSSNYKNKLNIIIPFKTEAYYDKNRKAHQPDYSTSQGGITHDYIKQGQIKTSYNIYNYYDFGVKKLEENKIVIAQKYFEQALKVKKNDVDALYNLGVCYFKQKKKEKACDSWIAAWQLGDKGAQALLEKHCK